MQIARVFPAPPQPSGPARAPVPGSRKSLWQSWGFFRDSPLGKQRRNRLRPLDGSSGGTRRDGGRHRATGGIPQIGLNRSRMLFRTTRHWIDTRFTAKIKPFRRIGIQIDKKRVCLFIVRLKSSDSIKKETIASEWPHSGSWKSVGPNGCADGTRATERRGRPSTR